VDDFPPRRNGGVDNTLDERAYLCQARTMSCVGRQIYVVASLYCCGLTVTLGDESMKRSEELVKCFGDEAIKALKENGTWEYSPETTEVGIWFPWWCNDCETWHNEWKIIGYRIEDGHVYEVIHSYDDSDWDVDDEYDVDDEDYEKWTKQYGYEESIKAMNSYFEWVVENGEDPLNEFMFADSKEKVIESAKRSLRI